MLDHTLAPERVVEEFERVLRPGGMIHLHVDIGGKPNVCEPQVFSRDEIPRLFSRFELAFEDTKVPSNPARQEMLIRGYRKPGGDSRGDESVSSPPTRGAERPAGGEPAAFPPPRYLEILACPQCRGELATTGGGLRCEDCRRSFPAESGVAILLPET
jgi:hypothetical protein